MMYAWDARQYYIAKASGGPVQRQNASEMHLSKYNAGYFVSSWLRICCLSDGYSPLCSILRSQFVDEINNDVVLLDAHAVEVLSYGQRQAVFVLSTGVSLACHGWRV
jgi:hypothetical protein